MIFSYTTNLSKMFNTTKQNPIFPLSPYLLRKQGGEWKNVLIKGD